MRVTLEQWQALVAVVDRGSYSAAAEQLHKSQSTVSYAVQRIETLLGVVVFVRDGRRSVLTADGEALVRRARGLIDAAVGLERGATNLARGVEPVVTLAVDILFPTWLLLRALDSVSARYPATRIDLIESVLGGTDEALFSGRAQLVVTTSIPAGFTGQPLLSQRLFPVAHPSHPLHALGRDLSLEDLRGHRQLVVRDTAVERKRDSGGWLGADQRWTVSHKATSIAAACKGLGFAWYAEGTIRRELDAGLLKPLPLSGGGERHATLYLVLADVDLAGPVTRAMAEALEQAVSESDT